MNFLKPGFTHKDLLNIDDDDLPLLADEVRAVIIDTVRKNGGHLGSSLGVVELTIAMLKVFDPLNDRIIFDVGHQSYPYKILTDRFDQFHTLRQKDGLSGFPRRNESPYDHFNTGHSSTSISAALGYAKARDLLGENRNVVAFIGDASLINGLAFEALNYVHETNSRLIIILNDNRHSISNRVGGFSTVLAELSANTWYRGIKNFFRRHFPEKRSPYEGSTNPLARARNLIKAFTRPINLFDKLGIKYWGPFDGHDIANAVRMLTLAKNYYRPVILHFNTVKGKGLPEAEANPTKYHQVSPAGTPKFRTWSEAASEIAEELAMKDERIVCFTAAMMTGVKLERFSREFPGRFFDVGIAESHMLTMAAGLAAGGMRPWVFIYSTFLQRAMDQLMHDIALQNLPVVIMVDRAGLAGSDGDTHQGMLDIPWGRSVPNLEIYAPCDEDSLRECMIAASKREGPTLIRYPRGKIPHGKISVDSHGEGIVKIHDGHSWALFGNGSSVGIMLDVRDMAGNEGVDVPAVYDVRRVKPVDAEELCGILGCYKAVAVLEDNYMAGGFGEAFGAVIAEKGLGVKLLRFGVPDVCVKHATQEQQRELYGITARNIIDSYRNEA
ncbi:MAG: 1-deoxy-D-xylulose-5-phosphate synthase [Synergistaceae bacterium]|nr:1-deoxy-D-xylulose-5-phosphate synthase [Synergistaceae bacterium]